MFLSLSTWIYQALPMESVMEQARVNRFGSVEVSGDTWIHGWTWPRIVEEAARNEVRVASIHCIHHTAREGLTMQEQGYVEYHKRLYDMLAEKGGEELLVVEHVPHGSFEEVADRAVAEMGELVQLGQDRGLRIATENMSKAFGSPHEMQYLLDRVPGLLWTFDAGHAQTAGVKPLDFAPLFNERLANVHVIDIHPSVRLGDWLPTGLGVIDWDSIIAALAASSYGGPLTVELTATQLREVIAVCDQVLAATGSCATELQAMPWEDLFVQYARSNLLQTCARQGVHLTA